MTGNLAFGEIWRVHDEINLWLIENIPEPGFAAHSLLKNGQPSKGRDVGRVFLHMHEVRLSRATAKHARSVLRLSPEQLPARADLLTAFRGSGGAVSARLAELSPDPEPGKQRSPSILLGYLIAHDSHHRGQILLALKQSGIRMPDAARFGIWEHWFKEKLSVST